MVQAKSLFVVCNVCLSLKPSQHYSSCGHLRVWRQQHPAHPDEVVLAHLDAGAGHLDLQHGQDVVVLGADVAVPAEGRHGDGVLVQDGRVVRVAAVYDAHAAVAGRQPPGEDGDEGTGEDHLQRLKGLNE